MYSSTGWYTAIANLIPQLIPLLESGDYEIRIKTANQIAELAEIGEFCRFLLAVTLTYLFRRAAFWNREPHLSASKPPEPPG